MNEPLPPDWNPTMRIPASRAARLPPDMIRPATGRMVEISVRDFFLACDPSPEELAEGGPEAEGIGAEPAV